MNQLFLNTLAQLESSDPKLIAAIKKAYSLCEAYTSKGAVPYTGNSRLHKPHVAARNGNEFLEPIQFTDDGGYCRRGSANYDKAVARSAKKKFNFAHSPDKELELEVGCENPEDINVDAGMYRKQKEASAEYTEMLQKFHCDNIEYIASLGRDDLNRIATADYEMEDLPQLAQNVSNVAKALRKLSDLYDAENGTAHTWDI